MRRKVTHLATAPPTKPHPPSLPAPKAPPSLAPPLPGALCFRPMPFDPRHTNPLAPDVGPYRPVALLGSGGMGVVYRAMHVQTGQWVALKVLLGSHSGRALALRREIRALTRLAHPGLARIVAHGADFERPWLAMQLVEGETLWPFL